MTKGSLVDLAKTILNGGNNNVKIDSSEISVVADIAISTLIGFEMKDNTKESYYDIVDSFVSTFEDVEIKFDPKRNEYFSFLPAPPIILSRDAHIRLVSGMKGQRTPFNRMSPTAGSVFKHLEAGKMLGTTYYLELGKVVYDKLPTIIPGGKPSIDTVLIKMIASTSILDDDDPIPVTGQYEGQLLQMISQLIREEKFAKQDDYDDSSTNNAPAQ